jgi:hypothetical protein
MANAEVGGRNRRPAGESASRAPVKLLIVIAGLAVALTIPAAARGGDQAYLSWTLDDQGARPTVTWTITGSTKWYVGVIQIATERAVNADGDFRPANLVVYEVLDRAESNGYWISAQKLGPGTYYGRLTLRYDGPCQTNCQSLTSVRSFTIDPPPLKSLTWKVTPGIGTVTVTWTKPKNGWFVGMVLVDDDRNFSSPEDAKVWPTPPKGTSWVSGLLPRDTYYVRLRARHGSCETCIWTSPPKTVVVRRSNSPPQLKPVQFEITQRDEKTGRHTWKATFTVCDRTAGKLTIQIVEETGPAGGSVTDQLMTKRSVASPNGCRSYALTKQSAFPFSPGTFVRVSIRARDSLGAWSLRTRKVNWVTTA